MDTCQADVQKIEKLCATFHKLDSDTSIIKSEIKAKRITGWFHPIEGVKLCI